MSSRIRLRTLPIYLLFLFCFFTTVFAEQDLIDPWLTGPLRCMGVYAAGDVWNSQYEASVQVSIQLDTVNRGNVAIVIYEYNDFPKIGLSINNQMNYICTETLVSEGHCTNATLGAFITDPPEDFVPKTSIMTKAIHLTSTDIGAEEGLYYLVNKTGYYCAAVVDADTFGIVDYPDANFLATVTWRGANGWLSGSDYPKLTLYGMLSITYLILGALWGYQSYRYWDDILPIQNYIGGVMIFLSLEMGVIWMYYGNYNEYGTQSIVLLSFVAILNSARNSISFFMLLVVCLGWGVVQPTLGPTMRKCQGLALCHFFFGVIYATGTMLLDPETAGPIIFLVIFPLAMTMTLFYVWTLHAIRTTLVVLTLKKQTVKVTMFRRLWWLLVWTISMVIALFTVDFLLFWERDTEGWGAQHWRSKWFLVDGWNNILYLVTFIIIAFLWRPTDQNRRFGLDQLAQDEDEAMDLEEGLHSARKQGLGKKIRKGGIDEGLEEGIFDLGDESDEETNDVKPSKSAVNTGEEVEVQIMGVGSSHHGEEARGDEGNGLLSEDEEVEHLR